MGFFKRKKKEEEVPALPPKKEKKPEPTGSPWAAFLVLAISVMLGVFFWTYGHFEVLMNGEVGLPTEQKQKGIRSTEEDEVIIFERE